MAKKAAKRVKTRRQRATVKTTTGPRTRRRSVKTKSRAKRRRRGMGDAASFARIKSAVKKMVFGGGGGVLASVGNKAMSGLNVWARTGINIGISVAMDEFLGWNNMAAGYAGGATALETQEPVNKMLSEMGIGESAAARYADGNSVNQLPLTLNDGGQILTLMEDPGTGTYYYMNDNNGVTYLAEDIYPTYMPRY